MWGEGAGEGVGRGGKRGRGVKGGGWGGKRVEGKGKGKGRERDPQRAVGPVLWRASSPYWFAQPGVPCRVESR